MRFPRDTSVGTHSMPDQDSNPGLLVRTEA
jgi:hypothetical protein